MNERPTSETYCIVGAGPAGLCMARNLQRLDIPFVGYERSHGVGGLWDIDNPHSSVYESAHLISSKTTTEFKEFPMPPGAADYPSHRELLDYFRSYADHFGLTDHYRFETGVEHIERADDGWNVRLSTGETVRHKGVILASGTLWSPKVPEFEGEFTGEFIHSKDYKSGEIFLGKRVLIIGAGNSGCDIAVDAVHRADRVSMSVRRGYHFVPKYVFGKPADTLGGLVNLPPKLKQRLDGIILKWFTGDPVKRGFPEPDHKLYESHPIVNTLVLYHLGHGDLDVQPDIDRFDGTTVHFTDGTSAEYDMVLLATGYKLDYPYIDRDHLNWEGMSPNLYLNIFHPTYDDLFVMGMIEAAGIGWEGRNEQARLVAEYIRACQQDTEAARAFREAKRDPNVDLSGGFSYMKKENMAYYVHKDTYRNRVRREIERFTGSPVPA